MSVQVSDGPQQFGFAPLGTIALGEISPALTPATLPPTTHNNHVLFSAIGQVALGEATVPFARNNPRAPVRPKGTRTLEMPWSALVTAADPDWRRAHRDQVEFEFGGGRRIFRHNPFTRGPYEDDD